MLYQDNIYQEQNNIMQNNIILLRIFKTITLQYKKHYPSLRFQLKTKEICLIINFIDLIKLFIFFNLTYKIMMNQTQRNRANSQKDQITKKNIRKYSSDYSDSDVSDLECQVKKRIVKIWTPDEDEMLQKFYEKYQGNWTQIAQSIPNRNPSQCSQRWKRINPNRIRSRRQWTEEEDQKVLNLIKKFGKNWKAIENHMYGRNGKQIRERFINKLDQTINHNAFTLEEDEKIVNLYLNMGPKWSEISKLLKGRPENMIKNRFYSHIKKHYNIQQQNSEFDENVILNNQFESNSSQLDQQKQDEQKLETIHSQFELEGSFFSNLINNNHILLPQFKSLIQGESLISNAESIINKQEISMEQKQIYRMDTSGVGSHIYQDISMPHSDIYEELDSSIKKTPQYIKTDSDNEEKQNQLQDQIIKMSIEQD
ncbi:unnamed protein product [Paramecium sonneborni]|uniref:Uncharacterized protein n=1 Tax=Paramecium sonneborni TaxID=65129 RepID=A0A8S1KNL4_9CILI|nr:unnamed protein product [Paramecium sonneborni]